MLLIVARIYYFLWNCNGTWIGSICVGIARLLLCCLRLGLGRLGRRQAVQGSPPHFHVRDILYGSKSVLRIRICIDPKLLPDPDPDLLFRNPDPDLLFRIRIQQKMKEQI